MCDLHFMSRLSWISSTQAWGTWSILGRATRKQSQVQISNHQSVFFHHFRPRFIWASDLSGSKAEDNICWLISAPYTLMFVEFTFPTHPVVQLVLLTKRLTACVSPPPCSNDPRREGLLRGGVQTRRECRRLTGVPGARWVSCRSSFYCQWLKAALAFIQMLMQLQCGAETWSSRFYPQKWPNPLNSLFFLITFLARAFFTHKLPVLSLNHNKDIYMTQSFCLCSAPSWWYSLAPNMQIKHVWNDGLHL